ncbi:MAG TPA: LPS export ABC transporter periplasmic protein LptC [Thermodesulfobacteriota bacterium]|nr:LPS export ABC transporter periplasmic protein LptC [Thermodesulfobacteriota bacterium]
MRSTKTLRFLLGGVVLASLGGVAILVWTSLAPGPEKKTAPPPPQLSGDLKLDRVRYTETREGVKEWELEASSAVYFREQNTIVLDKIRATFFGKDQEQYFLEGEKGKFNTETRVIEVYGGVKIDSTSGYHLRTDSLKYRSEERELQTADPVEMNGPDLQVKGVGLAVSLNLQKVTVLGGVTTTLSGLAVGKTRGGR